MGLGRPASGKVIRRSGVGLTESGRVNPTIEYRVLSTRAFGSIEVQEQRSPCHRFATALVCGATLIVSAAHYC